MHNPGSAEVFNVPGSPRWSEEAFGLYLSQGRISNTERCYSRLSDMSIRGDDDERKKVENMRKKVENMAFFLPWNFSGPSHDATRFCPPHLSLLSIFCCINVNFCPGFSSFLKLLLLLEGSKSSSQVFRKSNNSTNYRLPKSKNEIGSPSNVLKLDIGRECNYLIQPIYKDNKRSSDNAKSWLYKQILRNLTCEASALHLLYFYLEYDVDPHLDSNYFIIRFSSIPSFYLEYSSFTYESENLPRLPLFVMDANNLRTTEDERNYVVSRQTQLLRIPVLPQFMIPFLRQLILTLLTFLHIYEIPTSVKHKYRSFTKTLFSNLPVKSENKNYFDPASTKLQMTTPKFSQSKTGENNFLIQSNHSKMRDPEDPRTENHSKNFRKFTFQLITSIMSLSWPLSRRRLLKGTKSILIISMMFSLTGPCDSFALEGHPGPEELMYRDLQFFQVTPQRQISIGLILPHSVFDVRAYMKSINRALKDFPDGIGPYEFSFSDIKQEMFKLTPSPKGKKNLGECF